MSVSFSQPEKTNLYMNSINSQDKKINVLIPDGVLTCNPNEDFYITIISFNVYNQIIPSNLISIIFYLKIFPFRIKIFLELIMIFLK